MMRDIVEDVVRSDPDINVTVTDSPISELGGQADSVSADLVIVGCEARSANAQGTALLRYGRQRRVLAITPNGRDAVLFALTPTRRALGELSPQSLLSAIRETGAPGEPEADA